jgi:WD40 repeat protein
MKNNDLSWSPTFPTSILLASEDHNLYTFDIRRLSTPSQIYKAHVSAVTSCDWSPTGTEFVSGGWDRTLRIWQEGHGTHPEVYHTKRMQRVLATAFTADVRSCSPAPTTATYVYGRQMHQKNSASSQLASAPQLSTAMRSKNAGRWTPRSAKCNGTCTAV